MSYLGTTTTTAASTTVAAALATTTITITKAITHNDALVRPETANVPHLAAAHDDDDENVYHREQPELIFFNTFFCPYAQMAWIALNEKHVSERTKFIEGLTIQHGDYKVHPELAALGRSGVPTLYHPTKERVLDGSTDCVEYIDRQFGTPYWLLPKDPMMLRKARRCETLLHSIFTFPFYSMLLRQEPQEQEKAKRELNSAIDTLVQDYQGPFYLGEQFTVADIAVAPYFDRMVVLEHYRNFTVPTTSTNRWNEWKQNVLERPSVAATRQDRDRIIEAYKRYAYCYVRNNWYQRVFIYGR